MLRSHAVTAVSNHIRDGFLHNLAIADVVDHVYGSHLRWSTTQTHVDRIGSLLNNVSSGRLREVAVRAGASAVIGCELPGSDDKVHRYFLEDYLQRIAATGVHSSALFTHMTVDGEPPCPGDDRLSQLQVRNLVSAEQ